jgi:hypothetical protein
MTPPLPDIEKTPLPVFVFSKVSSEEAAAENVIIPGKHYALLEHRFEAVNKERKRTSLFHPVNLETGQIDPTTTITAVSDWWAQDISFTDAKKVGVVEQTITTTYSSLQHEEI